MAPIACNIIEIERALTQFLHVVWGMRYARNKNWLITIGEVKIIVVVVWLLLEVLNSHDPLVIITKCGCP